MEAVNYQEINRQRWNQSTEYHLKSSFYDVAAFKEGKNSLNSIELALLGDVKGKSLLHLQCHFGQDSLSLQRMGAEVTGIDLSDKAIETAQMLSDELNLPARFICTDVYDTPKHLDGRFDIVFASYGVIGWLPDLERWAAVIRHFLKPGGKLVFVEFHPVVWMFDDRFEKIAYSYFNDGPIIEKSTGTYADREAPMETESVSWNHGLSEVLQSLLKQGITLTHFSEYDYSPYACFPEVTETGPGQYRIPGLEGKLPMVYALTGTWQ